MPCSRQAPCGLHGGFCVDSLRMRGRSRAMRPSVRSARPSRLRSSPEGRCGAAEERREIPGKPQGGPIRVERKRHAVVNRRDDGGGPGGHEREAPIDIRIAPKAAARRRCARRRRGRRIGLPVRGLGTVSVAWDSKNPQAGTRHRRRLSDARHMLEEAPSAVSMRVLNTGPFFQGTSYPQIISAMASCVPSPVGTMSAATDEGKASRRSPGPSATGLDRLARKLPSASSAPQLPTRVFPRLQAARDLCGDAGDLGPINRDETPAHNPLLPATPASRRSIVPRAPPRATHAACSMAYPVARRACRLQHGAPRSQASRSARAHVHVRHVHTVRML